jgi:hypothetical protein
MTSVRYGLGCLTLFATLSWPGRACAEQKYYFAVLSYPEQTQGAHTIALLIKTTAEGEAEGKVDTQTITWMGAGKYSRRAPVKLDKSHTEVLERSHNLGVRCTMWGPYPIQQGFYDHVLRQAAADQAGLAGIRNDSDVSASGSMAAYLHAVANVSEATGDPRAAREANRLLVLRGLEPWILPPGDAPDWLRERLELKKYGVVISQRCH